MTVVDHFTFISRLVLPRPYIHTPIKALQEPARLHLQLQRMKLQYAAAKYECSGYPCCEEIG
jgi:hypothetical protein